MRNEEKKEGEEDQEEFFIRLSWSELWLTKKREKANDISVCLSHCQYVCLIGCLSVCTFVCLSVSLFVWQFDCPSLCLFVRLPAYVFFSVSKGTSIGSLSVCLCLSVKSILYDFLIARLSYYRPVCVAVSFSTMSVCLTATVFVCLSLCLSAILIIHQIIGFP